LVSLMFAGIMAACRVATTTPPPPLVIPSPSAAPTAPEPTLTPQPRVYATARELPVNCRFGPGTIYTVISLLDAGRYTRVEARDETGGWLYIRNPLNPGGYCWISTVPVDVEGDTTFLPVQPPPLVSVSKLDVRVEPQRVTVACNNYPQYALFIAEVTTNGPTLVNWRWELSTGEATEPQVILFDQADTRTLTHSFVIMSPNDYWGRLHINAPNNIDSTAILIANCTQ